MALPFGSSSQHFGRNPNPDTAERRQTRPPFLRESKDL
jgi:hypothetical protein